jgi:hypothetical protein
VSNAGIPVCQAINPFHDLEVIHHTYHLPTPFFHYFSVKAGSCGRLGYSLLPDNPFPSRPAVHLAVKSVWLFFHDLP